MHSYFVWGLDPSSTATGWGIVRFEERATLELHQKKPLGHLPHLVNSMIPEYIDSGVIRPDPNLPANARLGFMSSGIGDLWASHSGSRPSLANIEDQFVGINSKTQALISRAAGAVVGPLESLGVSCIDWTPTEVKKHVTGHGNATKQEVARAVERTLGLIEGRFSDDDGWDESDGVALALCPVKVT